MLSVVQNARKRKSLQKRLKFSPIQKASILFPIHPDSLFRCPSIALSSPLYGTTLCEGLSCSVFVTISARAEYEDEVLKWNISREVNANITKSVCEVYITTANLKL